MLYNLKQNYPSKTYLKPYQNVYNFHDHILSIINKKKTSFINHGFERSQKNFGLDFNLNFNHLFINQLKRLMYKIFCVNVNFM